MDWVIRPMTIEEHKYSYTQSHQLVAQTGCIGYLRGDFGQFGHGFYTSWEDLQRDLKSDEFKAELDEIINALHLDEDGLLASRQSMVDYGRNEPASAFQGNYTKEYGFRVDTKDHAFLIRCNPHPGDYNFYCYCYVSKWLDRNIEEAKGDIRFIDSSYTELFRIPDGGSIVITYNDGTREERECRYIDSAHIQVGSNLYHSCEFAEIMEHCGAAYAPKEVYLPPECMSTMTSSGELIHITRYKKGYTPKDTAFTPEDNRAFADRWNERHGVSKAQEAAMVVGSMFGWHVPGAQPKNYDENGNAIKPKDRER